jgi:hypothetical protein
VAPQPTMGPQSQRRLTLTQRKHRLQSESHSPPKKQRPEQLTLMGKRAFDPIQDCKVCKAKHYGRIPPHKPHHSLCWNNRRTKGITSETTLNTLAEAKKLEKHFAQPLANKFSSQNCTKAAVATFLAPRKTTVKATTTKLKSTPDSTMPTIDMQTIESGDVDALYEAVKGKLDDAAFCKEHHNNRAPLGLLAVANVMVEHIIRKNDKSKLNKYFNGLTMTIPSTTSGLVVPHYHAVIGQKLLLVDWKKMYDVDVQCPSCNQASLCNDRTNFSKNKLLFPIYTLQGAPQWCMVMSMTCPSCKSRHNANDAVILSRLPAYAMLAYPVDTRYALLCRNSHLGRDATNVFDQILPTYGNGDLCSRLLYNAINRCYIERVSSYYSFYDGTSGTLEDYIEKNGEYLKSFPPLGYTIRDIYDEATNNPHNPWHVSDHDRHTREIQGVRCTSLFAQDHTHEVTKNYFNKKRLGAFALWDVSTETGEIATAVLVKSTKTVDFSHAAQQLVKRPGFAPSGLYSDTWPCKSDYWALLLGSHIQGRLGLFHFIQRITRTLRKRHVDYFRAITSLLEAVYSYQEDDYEALLKCLKNGSFRGIHYSDDDISYMKSTKMFRQRYDKYLRKVIRPPHLMQSMLDDWFDRFKCSTSSENARRPALGRLDPITQQTLFTPETRTAWTNCKEKAEYLQDPLPLDQMYVSIAPNPNSSHGLTEYLSRRGESSLESFHLLLAHFGNCGMKDSLADNLNLTGTARYNLMIRHKYRLASLKGVADGEIEQRKTPAGWESFIAYYNHAELAWVNQLATSAGASKKPFANVETLEPDTGERFFSEYLSWMKQTKPKYDAQDRCLCAECAATLATTEGSTTTSPTRLLTLSPNSNDNNPSLTSEKEPSLPVPLKNIIMEDSRMLVNNNLAQTPAHSLPYMQQRLQSNQQPVQHAMAPTQVLPFWQQNFINFPFPFQPTYCCPSYRVWHTHRRRGRPPHDYNCQRQQTMPIACHWQNSPG